MSKGLITIAAAFATLSLAALSSAQAGNGAPGTPAKYNNEARTATHAVASSNSITEFSSSSQPTNHGPKR